MLAKAFSPKKWKLIASSITTLFSYYYFHFEASAICATVFCLSPEEPCQNFPLEIILRCCGCYTFVNFLGDIIIVFILPFLFSYIVFSIIAELIKRK